MKVSTLIKKLQKLDPNLPVFVRGYEGGVDDIRGIAKRKLVKNYNKGVWYYGAHESAGRTHNYVGYELWGENR